MNEPAPLQLVASLDRPLAARGVAGLMHLVAELQAGSASAVERAPLALVLALDTSGSMQGEKLRHVVASVEFLVQQLLPHDRLGVIAFSHTARVVVPLGPPRHLTPRLEANGDTNVEAGLRLASAQLKHAEPGHRRAMLLLSDGLPNAGAMAPRALAQLAVELEVAVSTLGYGADHSDEVLSAVSEAGRGTYAYVPTPELCKVELARAVSGQAEVAADSVCLVLRPARGVTVERVLGAPSVGGFAEHGGLEVPLPDFHAGERRAIAFALKHDAWAELGPAAVAHVELEQRGLPPRAFAVSAEVGEVAGPVVPPVHGVRLQCSARAARTAATQLADAGKFDEAKRVLAQVAEEIRRAPASASSAALNEMLEQLVDDIALMNARPDAEARAAFRRGQGAVVVKRPALSTMVGAAFSRMPKARLIIIEGADPAEVQLRQETVLGRTASADVQLQASGVSRQHTKIVASDGGFWVNDLGSTNGTLLNGAHVSCERLRDGDVIHVGGVKLLYREG